MIVSHVHYGEDTSVWFKAIDGLRETTSSSSCWRRAASIVRSQYQRRFTRQRSRLSNVRLGAYGGRANGRHREHRETKPLIGTQMAAFSQVAETSRPTFQGGSTGSNPVGATTKKSRSAAKFASPASCVVLFGTRVGRELNRQQSVQAVGNLPLLWSRDDLRQHLLIPVVRILFS